MLGAAALTCQAAMRAGAGLVTLGIPKELNLAAQKKISPVIMTLPLAQTKEQTLSVNAYFALKKELHQYDVIALGPGLSQNPSTQRLILKIIASLDIPLVIDADALSALAQRPIVLKKQTNIKILTPHPGEMKRLVGKPISSNTAERKCVAQNFARQYNCIVALKGHHTVVASHKKIHLNTTGNVGMATAGSGDVLTGMVASFLAQKIDAFTATKYAVFLHGKSGDLAAKEKGKAPMTAVDILEKIPDAIKSLDK